VNGVFESRRPVSSGEFESLLAAAAAEVANPNAGLFGPDSISWRVNRESALFLGAGRAALLQLAHPWVMAALKEHSNLLDRPIARFHNTFRVVFTMVFGSRDQAIQAARHLYALHARIRGELKQGTAGWARGTHYEANEINALRWVYATLIESAVLAYECAVGPLSAEERERYYTDSRTLAALFGIPAAALSDTWDAFLACNRAMQASDQLGVSEDARRYAAKLLTGSGSWVRPPAWYRALTIAWLPERFRAEFSLAFGEAERNAAEAAARRLPEIYRRLPAMVRFLGPYHEARARITRRRCGVLTRLSNRFWIGEERLPFADSSALRKND
jgi:uncharacterized protein (DUF2236 family)